MAADEVEGEGRVATMSERFFDLNIQQMLEHWTVSEALREVIANALDEQALTGTREPQIFRDDNCSWHIRDFGRGLRYEHFTQNEDLQKLEKPELVIGKFGVGLKDAMATFDRHHIGVTILSRHARITLASIGKHGFGDVQTLHAVVSLAPDPGMVGTEFILTKVSDEDIALAKGYFLRYSGDTQLDATRYGTVLERGSNRMARIYVNGLRVAEEPNFLFSYKITSLTKTLRAALNRERTNVGRQAYSDRVKAILLASSGSAVADSLVEDLAAYESGRHHDETAWVDVGLHACKVANAHQDVIFVTAMQLHLAGGLITQARADGYRVIVIPETLSQRLPVLRDIDDKQIRDLSVYGNEWNESFEYDFIDLAELGPHERAVFDLAPPLLKLLPGETERVKDICVSRTMRISAYSYNEVLGVWDPEERRIVIKRSQLASQQSFVSTLLHEIAHAMSAAPDRDERFEHALTHLLGRTGTVAATRA